MPKTEKELKTQIRSLQKQLRNNDAWWGKQYTELCDESKKFRRQRDCMHQKRHKEVFTGEIIIDQNEIRIQYKCPFCCYKAHIPSKNLTNEQKRTLAQLGIVPRDEQ